MRVASPLMFVAAVLAFFLPFVQVSCNNHPLASASGIDLAFGKTVQVPQVFGPSQSRKIDPNPNVLFALITAVAGALLAFSGGRLNKIASVLAALIGVACLFTFQSNVKELGANPSAVVLSFDFQFGYFAAIAMLIGGGFTSAIVALEPEGVDGFDEQESVW